MMKDNANSKYHETHKIRFRLPYIPKHALNTATLYIDIYIKT